MRMSGANRIIGSAERVKGGEVPPLHHRPKSLIASRSERSWSKAPLSLVLIPVMAVRNHDPGIPPDVTIFESNIPTLLVARFRLQPLDAGRKADLVVKRKMSRISAKVFQDLRVMWTGWVLPGHREIREFRGAFRRE